MPLETVHFVTDFLPLVGFLATGAKASTRGWYVGSADYSAANSTAVSTQKLDVAQPRQRKEVNTAERQDSNSGSHSLLYKMSD